MVTRLENNKVTKEKLDNLQDIYLIVCWIDYGYLTFKDSGLTEYDKDLKVDVPLVWQYDDFNGTDDAYYLRPITLTTTGSIHTWTYDKDLAKNLIERLNKK